MVFLQRDEHGHNGQSKMPTPTNPKPKPPAAQPAPPPSGLHPEAMRAAADWSDLCRLRDRLLDENQQLRNAIEVDRRQITELQHQLDRVTERADFFQRYAVEIGTHLDLIATSAVKARERAIEMARRPEPLQQEEEDDLTNFREVDEPAPPKSPELLEQDIQNIARRFGPKPPPG